MISLRRHFIREWHLPIALVEDPYFEALLDLYEPLWSARSKWSMFEKDVQEMGTEVFGLVPHLRKTAMQYWQSLPVYARFAQDDLSQYPLPPKVPGDSLYHPSHHQQSFVSIDLNAANFQAMRFYDPSLVAHTDCWKDFVQTLGSTSRTAQHSKRIRQVVFGDASPMQQQKIQRILLGLVAQDLVKAFGSDVRQLGADELIVRLQAPLEQIQAVCEDSRQRHGVDIRVEPFCLERLEWPHGDAYLRKRLDGTPMAIKKADPTVLPQLVRKVLGQAPQPLDLAFVHQGQMATFLKPLF